MTNDQQLSWDVKLILKYPGIFGAILLLLGVWGILTGPARIIHLSLIIFGAVFFWIQGAKSTLEKDL